MHSPPPSSISRWDRGAGRFCARAPFPPTRSSWSCKDKRVRMERREDSKPRGPTRRRAALVVVLLLLLALVAGVAGWCHWVYAQIESYAGRDQAAPSDAI